MADFGIRSAELSNCTARFKDFVVVIMTLTTVKAVMMKIRSYCYVFIGEYLRSIKTSALETVWRFYFRIYREIQNNLRTQTGVSSFLHFVLEKWFLTT
jgi:hypothetical protein